MGLMPLFLAQHRHHPDRCPASAGRTVRLLSEISAANAARHRVTIEAEAIIDGEHRLILILEAPDREAVQSFLTFLRECGELQILAASPAEAAVERGGCDLVGVAAARLWDYGRRG
jgi:hypothetical protein